MKELQIFGVEEYTDVIENLQYSVEKPNAAKWSFPVEHPMSP
jgi:hypothetical protein